MQNRIAETLFIPLYFRALEAQRRDALLKDDMAQALVNKIDYDFTRIKLHASDQASIILRTREFDRQTRLFLSGHSASIVVHIGCGLDTRFQRVDDGTVIWYDLDLPEVMDLRRQLITEAPRCNSVEGSVFEEGWMTTVKDHPGRALLMLAEGVFPYFEAAQIKRMVIGMRDRFPGSELLFDFMTPFLVRLHNVELAFSRFDARLHWGLKKSRDLEMWADDIRLQEDWYYLDQPELRLGAHRLMRHFPPLRKCAGICRYRLGSA